ncbi:hypothetical protein HCDG_01907 [Histoplasma capsulatum H143]|uniref:Secreted peptide n=1 Tax=Ajellomyces capsulatus (strain H143) TaxID=544712 RepID=C6H656_AJECH|nr:hypothetical protein HCDG_01907 [Histoplasma capsulatum H143]
MIFDALCSVLIFLTCHVPPLGASCFDILLFPRFLLALGCSVLSVFFLPFTVLLDPCASFWARSRRKTIPKRKWVAKNSMHL